jgi:RNA polymerase sigma factor for flagellar operon FliA
MSPSTQLATKAENGQTAAALTQQHVGLVHHVARQLARRLHDKVDLDELVSAGAIGLMQAAASYEPSRGLTFSTYAVPRIRGSMLDELRRHDHMSRGARRKARAMSAAREALLHRFGREPKSGELALELNIDLDTFHQWQVDVDGAVEVSLDVAPRVLRDEGQVAAAGAIADESAPSIEEQLSHAQRVALLGVAIRGLRVQERTVLALYYYEELTLQQIAHVLGLSASRISQIRGEAIARLRQHLMPILD